MPFGRQTMIVPQDKLKGSAFVIVQWQGVRRENLLHSLRRAVTKWMVRCDSGKEACVESDYHFTIADVENHLADPALKALLELEGVHGLEVTLVDADFPPVGGWKLDDNLRETPTATHFG